MAFTNADFHLRPGAAGSNEYTYNATTTGASDALAEILVAGYFNNTDDDINLVVGDMIFCRCTDGNMNVVVSAVSSGSVTCQFAGGNLPTTQSQGSGTGACDAVLLVGAYQLTSATGDGTSTHWFLPAPYPGAEVKVRLNGSFITSQHFDCGGATTELINDKGDRRILLKHEGDEFHVVGISTTRWNVAHFHSAGEATGASDAFLVSTSIQGL